MMQLHGVGAVVTGGAGVIGSAICEALMREGARVAVMDQDQQRLGALKERLPDCYILPCDCGDEHQVEHAVAEARAQCGRLGVLVLASGPILSRPLVTPLDRQDPVHPLRDWHTVMHGHLTAGFLVGRAVAKWMVHDRSAGVLIGMGSVAARGNAGQSAYAAAKAGLRALLSVWAKELAPLGIRSVCIEPGFMDTPSTRAALDEHQLDQWRQQVPLRRLGETDHILQAIRYAIANEYLTDCVLPVDGGLRV